MILFFRYYEIVDETPYIYYLNQFISSSSQKSLGWMPKRGLNVSACEIFRFYKVQGAGNIIEPISFTVPRKSTLFQSDLYPDTLSTKAAMSVNDWFKGCNAKPNMMSMIQSKETFCESVIRTTLKKKHEPEVKNKREDEIIDNKYDTNINKKIAFLAHETIPDYRSSSEKFTDKNDKTKYNLQSIFNQQNIKDNNGKSLANEDKLYVGKMTSSQTENEVCLNLCLKIFV